VLPAAPAARAMLTYDRFSVVYSSDVGAGALPLNLDSISTFFSLAPTFFRISQGTGMCFSSGWCFEMGLGLTQN
jgi:hypothetical protein